MKRWLTLVCILGSLGGAFSQYTPISVGSAGLTKMSASLQQIATSVTAFSSSLNTGRNQVFVILNDLMGYVNITYTAMNKTWGQNQTEMRDFLEMVSYLNQTVVYGDQAITSQVNWNLYSLSTGLQNAIENIMQYYNMLVSQMGYDRVDNCTTRNSTQMTAVPTILAKFVTCLQLDTAAVTQYLPSIATSLLYAKTELVTLINQLKLCSFYATSCQNYYFGLLHMELSILQTLLSNAHQLIYAALNEAGDRDDFCGRLIKADISDNISDLSQEFSRCLWPV